LLKHGANVNTKNEGGFTPLHAAVRNGHFEVVRELKNHGAELITSMSSFLNAPAAILYSYFTRVRK